MVHTLVRVLTTPQYYYSMTARTYCTMRKAVLEHQGPARQHERSFSNVRVVVVARDTSRRRTRGNVRPEGESAGERRDETRRIVERGRSDRIGPDDRIESDRTFDLQCARLGVEGEPDAYGNGRNDRAR